MSDATAKPKRSHPIRLTVLMLLGVALGLPHVGNMLDPVVQWSILIDPILGAISGLVVELLIRAAVEGCRPK